MYGHLHRSHSIPVFEHDETFSLLFTVKRTIRRTFTKLFREIQKFLPTSVCDCLNFHSWMTPTNDKMLVVQHDQRSNYGLVALIPVHNAFLITNPEQQRHINETLSKTRFHSRNNVIDISILLDRMTELKQAIASYVSCSPRRQWNARKAKRSQSPRGRGQGRKSKRYAGVYKRT